MSRADVVRRRAVEQRRVVQNGAPRLQDAAPAAGRPGIPGPAGARRRRPHGAWKVGACVPGKLHARAAETTRSSGLTNRWPCRALSRRGGRVASLPVCPRLPAAAPASSEAAELGDSARRQRTRRARVVGHGQPARRARPASGRAHGGGANADLRSARRGRGSLSRRSTSCRACVRSAVLLRSTSGPSRVARSASCRAQSSASSPGVCGRGGAVVVRRRSACRFSVRRLARAAAVDDGAAAAAAFALGLWHRRRVVRLWDDLARRHQLLLCVLLTSPFNRCGAYGVLEAKNAAALRKPVRQLDIPPPADQPTAGVR